MPSFVHTDEEKMRAGPCRKLMIRGGQGRVSVGVAMVYRHHLYIAIVQRLGRAQERRGFHKDVLRPRLRRQRHDKPLQIRLHDKPDALIRPGERCLLFQRDSNPFGKGGTGTFTPQSRTPYRQCECCRPPWHHVCAARRRRHGFSKCAGTV